MSYTNLSGLATLIYLRKSRADLEAEHSGAADTLARHRQTLIDFANRSQMQVGAIYEEVVSGDTIASRPQMQRLLNEVEQGMWQAVLVMEVPRLARGNTSDQGIVANAFKYSGTLIVTPGKTYNPEDEADEEYFEFGLFMSRREYKMINRRLQAGRNASIREGKYIGSIPPYGYNRQKIAGEKGCTLIPDPQTAPVVADIFKWYTEDHLTTVAIANRLNDAGIPTAKGQTWMQTTVIGILRNAHYAGYTTSGFRPNKKVVNNGVVKITRPINQKMELYPGRHQAIVSKEQYEAAQAIRLSHGALPIPKMHGLHNPLSGLFVCECCGRKMQRRNHTKTPAMLICNRKGCPTVGHYMDEVEKLLISSMNEWVIKASEETCKLEKEYPDIQKQQEDLKHIKQQLNKLELQEQRAFELVETNVYSPDVFAQRMAALQNKKNTFISQQSEIESALKNFNQMVQAKKEIIPKILHVTEMYYNITDNVERNNLLKSVLDHVVYHKTIKAGRSNRPTDLCLHIFPRIPMP